jgi:hypothetical protein
MDENVGQRKNLLFLENLHNLRYSIFLNYIAIKLPIFLTAILIETV